MSEVEWWDIDTLEGIIHSAFEDFIERVLEKNDDSLREAHLLFVEENELVDRLLDLTDQDDESARVILAAEAHAIHPQYILHLRVSDTSVIEEADELWAAVAWDQSHGGLETYPGNTLSVLCTLQDKKGRLLRVLRKELRHASA